MAWGFQNTPVNWPVDTSWIDAYNRQAVASMRPQAAAPAAPTGPQPGPAAVNPGRIMGFGPGMTPNAINIRQRMFGLPQIPLSTATLLGKRRQYKPPGIPSIIQPPPNLNPPTDGPTGPTGPTTPSPVPTTPSAPGPTAGPTNPSYTVGIQAGPVWNESQLASALSGMQQDTMRPTQAAPAIGQAAGDAISQQLGSLLQAGLSGAQTDFSRDVQFANRQQQLASEKARALAGVQHANFLAGRQEAALANEQPYFNYLIQLLGGLVA